MADPSDAVPFTSRRRFRLIVGVAALALASVVLWLVMTAGQETTDDAQIDGHVTQIAARVGGTVQQVRVTDNQQIEAGTLLVQIDPRDYQIALDRARAALADARAAAAAARSGVPITSMAAASNVSSAQGSVEQASSAVTGAGREIEVARARVITAQARRREADANATKAARDVERLRGLLAKDEVSQQQFDAAVASSDAARAAADSARSQIAEEEAGVMVAESRLAQARAGATQAQAALRMASTAPEQVAQIRARAEAALAQVEREKANLAQAELNLQYAAVTSPVRGIVSRKTVEVGQVIQAGQPVMAVIPLEDIWVTANFKETQITHMRAGQRATVKVDAFGGRTFGARVDSIAAATGARFSLLPPENATGNYVKVVQRVPVKIVLEPGQDPDRLLRPGLSVTPTVYTK